MAKHWIVYIVQKSNFFYTGITTDLNNRVRQHKALSPLHYETFTSKQEAAKREKIIKGWTRKKKFALIKGKSPE